MAWLIALLVDPVRTRQHFFQSVMIVVASPANSDLGWWPQDTMSVIVGAATLATFLVALVAFRQTLVQVRSARESLEIIVRSIELSLAGELRTLNTNSYEQRRHVLRKFPLSATFLARYPASSWEGRVDGQQLGPAETKALIDWLVATEHPAVRRWDDIGDLTAKDFQSANAVVGFLNDLCQMLADGTPGQYIFEQHHQSIIRLGALAIPLVEVRQQAGRWGVRLPSLMNRAAIFHSVQPRDRDTIVTIQRVIEIPRAHIWSRVTWRNKPPIELRDDRHIELFIPLVGDDGKTGSLWYADPPGRTTDIDYDAFRRYFEAWRSPATAPIRLQGGAEEPPKRRWFRTATR